MKNIKSTELGPDKKEFVPFTWCEIRKAMHEAVVNGVVPHVLVFSSRQRHHVVTHLRARIIEEFGHLTNRFFKDGEYILWDNEYNDDVIVMRESMEETAKRYTYLRKHPKPEENKEEDMREEKPVPKKHLSAVQAREISSRALDEVMRDIINAIIGAAEKGETNCLVTLKPHTISALWQKLTFLGYGLTEEVANQSLRISWEKNKED